MGSKLNLVKRIFYGFLILVILQASYGIYFYYSASTSQSNVNRVVTQTLPDLSDLLNAELSILELRMLNLRLNAETDQTVRTTAKNEIAELTAFLKNQVNKLNSNADKEIEKTAYSSFSKHYRTWVANSDKMLNMSDTGNFFESMAFQRETEDPSFRVLQESMLSYQKMYEGAQLDTLTATESLLSSAKSTSLFILFLAIGITLAIAFVMSKSITKPLSVIAERLELGADQTAQASGQVSISSQALASGATKQAASVEETSASLEEMASMTNHNKQNASSARALSEETEQTVKDAFDAMSNLTQAMDNISNSSDETKKIIKTIDEIAFQTNLLALNAAVEAARAGEAGAGFAVVADEVRTLAMRAAEAAKNTSSLIDESVQNIGMGSQLVSQANEAFEKVSSASGRINELLGEIDASSTEQADGIGQLNTAVIEIDNVVQDNAATAEESAAAAEELSAQSEEMKNAVTQLITFLGNRNHKGLNAPTEILSAPKAKVTAMMSDKSSSNSFDSGSYEVKAPSKPKTTKIAPKDVIPMDDDDWGSSDSSSFVDF